MKNIDLRLMALISELHKTRSVTRAAQHLGLSQSAASMSVKKLRRHFNDPIFVRTSRGMEPTPCALELIELLNRAERMLQTALRRHVVFDPAASDRVFHLVASDVAQVTMIPSLVRRLKIAAPSVQVYASAISDSTPRLLESGTADAAIGFLHPMGDGYCQQILFEKRFVCATRWSHPRVRGRLSAEQFQNEMHVAIETHEMTPSMIEKTLEANGVRRSVGLTLPSFLEIAPILAATDYLVIVPENLLTHLADGEKLQILELPFPLPAYAMGLYWHESRTQDPAVRWLRSVISGLFGERAFTGMSGWAAASGENHFATSNAHAGK